MNRLCKGLALVFFSVVGSCAATMHAAPSGALNIACSDQGALVYVDGRLTGKAGDFVRQPLALRAGAHRLELRAEGKLTAYRDVSVHPAETTRLEVTLRPDLDQRDAAP